MIYMSQHAAIVVYRLLDFNQPTSCVTNVMSSYISPNEGKKKTPEQNYIFKDGLITLTDQHLIIT